MHYKMLVLDLDGTLTNNKKEVTANTLHALTKAQQEGLKIVLASGRPTYGIAPIANKLELDKYGGYVLSFNGCEVIDWKSKELLHYDFLRATDIPYIYQIAKEQNFTIATYIHNSVVTEDANNEYVHKMALHNAMTIKEVSHFLDAIDRPIPKCLIVGEAKRLAELESSLQIQFKGRMEAFRSEPYFLEIVPQGIDKASSLNILRKKTGIDREEIIAVGDGFNDLSMIQYAGLGVAMANAQEIIKQNADFITLSNEMDGVAHVIERFIF